ncbi:hypothetical protein Q7P37_010746 [Cladosporium fusiforme]
MDHPPPVPPKDTPYKSAMDVDRSTPAPTSGSKRKREAHDEQTFVPRSSNVDAPDRGHSQSPKRSRQHLHPSDNYTSDDTTPVQPRNVRRKKGSRNLSNLNLRHAAERQARLNAESQPLPRESKFQEGSLTDKPSNKPPSMFTRFVRTDSGNIRQVDELMDDYHNGMPTPRGSVEIGSAKEQAQVPQRASAISSPAGIADDNNGFLFRFSRSLAASFHPVRMWKQVWEETHEELRQRNLAEIERKRILKEEAERRYAQMKASGQLEPQAVSRASVTESYNPPRTSIADSNITTRDSGVIFSSGALPFDHKRTTSNGSQLAPSTNDVTSQSESEAPEPALPSVVKTLRSRLSFKRPSLQNLRFDLKRTKSEFNLAATANAPRDSTASVSPVKLEIPESGLRKSHSRIDMRKQHKLSKRVSDLESKLQVARQELDHALEQASPMPKLNGKYERFTPNSTLKRRRFVPGQLESLPSERLLDPSQIALHLNEDTEVKDHRARAAAELERGAFDFSKGDDLMDVSEENDGIDDEVTVRVSHAQPYPARTSSLFKLDNNNIESLDNDTTGGAIQKSHDYYQNDDNMDFDDDNTITPDEQRQRKKAGGYATLDAKLKALDANVKMAARRPHRGKKRKSGDMSLRNYHPTAEEEADDDLEWELAQSEAKRRKSGGSTKKRTPSKSGAAGEDQDDTTQDIDTTDVSIIEPTRNDEHAPSKNTARASLDSQAAILEPVAEESDGDAVENTDPIKKQPSKAPIGARDSVQSGSDEELMTRAADAARKHRSRTPMPEADAAVPQETDGATDQTVQGAETEVPTKAMKSNRGHASKKKRTTKVDADFEWPEDVF